MAFLVQRDVLLVWDGSWAVISPRLVLLISLLLRCSIIYRVSTLGSERVSMRVHRGLRWSNLETLRYWEDILNVHQVLIEV